MSMELMVKAMKIRVGNPLRKLVLIKLADNASDQGECWPSYQHIADQCEISKRSVMNHIAALCESGLVKKPKFHVCFLLASKITISRRI
ncbi:TPA: helix-turn-helix domain-containing protein [Escherichia coli]|nr:helix-turn-helix domain-containing protein [Escherichia coli]